MLELRSPSIGRTWNALKDSRVMEFSVGRGLIQTFCKRGRHFEILMSNSLNRREIDEGELSLEE